MGIVLVFRSGSLEGRRQHLHKEIIRLGRKPDNDVVIPDNLVSSYHAEIRYRGSHYTLIDLQSTNGTFVNGTRIEKVHLHNSDKIEIGENGTAIEFRYDSEQEDSSRKSPRLVPISGSWERGNDPIELSQAKLSLGRSTDNDIIVGRNQGSVVSGRHAEIRLDEQACELEDLDSMNGTYVNGERIRAVRLHHGDRIELGTGGPQFEFCWEAHPRRTVRAARDGDSMFRKLQRAARGGPAGEKTMMLLHAANRYYKRRRWPLLVLSGIVILIAAVVGALYYRERKENAKYRQLASDVFYQMRTIDAELVGMRQRQGMTFEFQSATEKKERQLREYDKYLETLGLYTGKSETEKSVMRMARELGETDLAVPPDFYRLAMSYVEKWRGTATLREAVERARQNGMLTKIRVKLDQQGLPREFLYIALQESKFDPKAVGQRPTRFGFAKGMWQFIPPTARDYGLQLGPLQDQQVYDAMDERHNDLKSTDAAARYLAYLYSTKAAASGLLVIASYNYGDTRIINRLDGLPNDPRVKNFWNFYRNGWLPDETRDYVMNIFSAAIICENPDTFNFAIQPVR
jgi:membrane-bound lytic murein transglycosylase D